jgi:hypothetical protein
MKTRLKIFLAKRKKKLLSLQVSLYKLLMNWKYERVDIFIHVTKLIFLVADKGSCPTIIIMAKPPPRSTCFLSGMNNWNKKVERDENSKKSWKLKTSTFKNLYVTQGCGHSEQIKLTNIFFLTFVNVKFRKKIFPFFVYWIVR